MRLNTKSCELREREAEEMISINTLSCEDVRTVLEAFGSEPLLYIFDTPSSHLIHGSFSLAGGPAVP